MKYFSVFITILVQQSAVRAVETEARAEHHCQDWFIYQGEQIENIFFKHVASGGQSDVYKCESLRLKYPGSLIWQGFYEFL